MTRRLPLALIAAAVPVLALAAEEGPGGWGLTTWPNAALLAQQTPDEGQFVLRQSLSCTPGDPQVIRRLYHPKGQRPAGSRRGCDTQCRTELVITDSDGDRPAGFSETRAPWSELQEQAATEAPALAARFARNCRLQEAGSTADSPLLRDASTAEAWTDLQPGWTLLPSLARKGDLPLTFTTPSTAWAYGAVSTPMSAKAPVLVRVQVEGVAGRAGVALVLPDGSALASGEQPIVPGDRATVYLRLKPGPQAGVLVRNYDSPGMAAVVRVTGMAVVAESALPEEERARIAPLVK